METTEQLQTTSVPEMFPLDDAAIEMIADIERQMMPLNVALNSVLSYFAKQQGLRGQWQLAPNKRELIKVA